MFELPFEDNAFDAVTSFNGIWNGCDGALREVRRVLGVDGQFGMTYWGGYERMGLLPYARWPRPDRRFRQSNRSDATPSAQR